MNGLLSRLRMRGEGQLAWLLFPALLSTNTVMADPPQTNEEMHARIEIIGERIAQLEAEKQALEEERKALQAELEPPPAPEPVSTAGDWKADLRLGAVYTGGKEPVTTVSSVGKVSYTTGSYELGISGNSTSKAKNKSTVWRNQLGAELHYPLNERIDWYAQGEYIQNTGLSKQNTFTGVSLNLLQGEHYHLKQELGLGLQHFEGFNMALVECTKAGYNLGFAKVRGNVRLVWANDEQYALQLKDKLIVWDLSLARRLWGLMELEVYHRLFDDKIPGAETFNVLGLGVRYTHP